MSGGAGTTLEQLMADGDTIIDGGNTHHTDDRGATLAVTEVEVEATALPLPASLVSKVPLV